MRLITTLLCTLTLTVASVSPSPPIVKTQYGPVQGSHSRKARVTSYHSIPFAAPPVGDLRWRPPVDPTPWTTPLKTTSPAPPCAQSDFIKGIHTGSEDCLYMSVYVPDGCSSTSPCPVLHWIYGGAWIIGSNQGSGNPPEYNGEHLASKFKVVVVAGNYRLDSLGWLALEEMEHESGDGSFGNFGLRDQRAALNWTQHNAPAFGGDPNQVTMFGESAGGWSVCQHLVSPASNRLFSRAVMESGDCDGPWMIFDGMDAQNWGAALTDKMGCSGPDRMKCLRDKPLKDVMLPYIDWLCPFPNLEHADPYCNRSAHDANATGGLTWPTARPPFAPIAGYAAVVDRTNNGLPDVPIRMIQAGRINVSPTGEKIQVMLGTNTDEFAPFLITVPVVIKGVKLPISDQALDVVAQHLIEYHRYWNETTKGQILAAYPASDYKHEAARLTAVGTDFCFRCGTRNAARALATHGIDVYLYQFDFHSSKYKAPDTLGCEIATEVGCGVAHGAELPFVFGNNKHPIFHPKAAKLTDIMGTYWTNFARYGTPNSGSVPVQWPKYNKDEDKHLVLAEKVEVSAHLAKPKCDFWSTLPREGPYANPHL